jgi:D-amino-acid oxidase
LQTTSANQKPTDSQPGGRSVQRRAFLKSGGAAGLALALGACGVRATASAPPRRRLVQLVPVDVSWDRIIRTTVGLRPYRESGFVLRAERLDDRMLVHNYGHGGSGMSLSWGTAQMAAELALEHSERRAAVIGCGISGLTTARQLQRRGFDVTIYAMTLPPDTTSNMSWAAFTPDSGLVANNRRTPQWDAQFRRAIQIAYREHQLLVGRSYGVSWIDEYSQATSPTAGGRGAGGRGGAAEPLLPASVQTGGELLYPGEHPFSTPYARRRPTLRFEPSILLEMLMRDVLAFGGRIVVRSFDTPRDLVTLSEPIIVNCTGLGSRQLFGDEELTPVKGQLTVLVPQPEVNYAFGGMLPRSDGIVLGHVMQRGEWSLDVDEDERRRVVEAALRTFGTMRAPEPGARLTTIGALSEPPPLESFLGRES